MIIETLRTLKLLYADYRKTNPTEGPSKRDKLNAFKHYIKQRIDFIGHLCLAPFTYPIYYIFRKEIADKLYWNFCLNNRLVCADKLDFFEHINTSLRSVEVDKKEFKKLIKQCLHPYEYRLWEAGDVKDPYNTGGVPEDYKTKLPMFWRRWFYSAIRNPYYTRVFMNYHSSEITELTTTTDNQVPWRQFQTYGLGNTYHKGQRVRWYRDKDNKWYFYYESVYKNLILGWRLHYLGFVSVTPMRDGIYPTGKAVYSERSNRPCSIKNI